MGGLKQSCKHCGVCPLAHATPTPVAAFPLRSNPELETQLSAERYHVVLNAHAGTANARGISREELAALCAAHGIDALIDANTDRPFADRIAEAVASPANVVVAAGGDGTITALASALVGTDKALAILPLGTVNALARDLEVPLDLDAAVAALATGERHQIDVGEVNGRVFLHKVVVGVIPAVAAGRERIRGRYDIGAKIGFLLYFARRLARSRRIAVAIQPNDGPVRIERVQALAVASNSYDEGPGRFFSRHCLDGGTLTLYRLKHLTVGDVLRLSVRMLMGHWQDDEALLVETVRSVRIDTRKSLVKVMFDGEIETLHTPLEFAIRPKALTVIVPAAEAAAEAA